MCTQWTFAMAIYERVHICIHKLTFFPLLRVLACDWKALALLKGINSANSNYFCLWCYCTKQQIADFSSKYSKAWDTIACDVYVKLLVIPIIYNQKSIVYKTIFYPFHHHTGRNISPGIMPGNVTTISNQSQRLYNETNEATILMADKMPTHIERPYVSAEGPMFQSY